LLALIEAGTTTVFEPFTTNRLHRTGCQLAGWRSVLDSSA